LLVNGKARLATKWLARVGLNAAKAEKIIEMTYGENLSVLTIRNLAAKLPSGKNVQRLSKR